MEQKSVIFFIGPQGSGKGTQAKLLAEKLGFFYWEMGSIIREKTTEDSPLGREAKELHDSGTLFNDDILIRIAEEKIRFLPRDRGIIFDGIPRRIGQATWLMKYLRAEGRVEFVTIYITIPREYSLERLLKRAMIEGRKDDTREKIEVRLRYYENDTVPVLSYLKNETKFIEIDGRPAVEEVTRAINVALGV